MDKTKKRPGSLADELAGPKDPAAVPGPKPAGAAGAAGDVPCPDCGMAMVAVGAVEEKVDLKHLCPQCGCLPEVVAGSETAEGVMLRCTQERHRIKFRSEERLERFRAECDKVKDGPARAAELAELTAKWVGEAAMRDGVVVTEPVTWLQRKVRRQRYKCPRPGCRFADRPDGSRIHPLHMVRL